ncbi:helix-turn-helix domain-containing protein [Pseudopelagicola sp. nBUS_20]|uniref:AraC family transcriptional regulator n=1 Tax=Pseudopelagicola sp. nBUS_20 TaxID=3395317 RepID=UPI003EBD0199
MDRVIYIGLMPRQNINIPSFMIRPGMRPMEAQPPIIPEKHPSPDTPLTQIKVQTIAQLTRGEPWLLEQLHVRNHHIILWTTRGQGRVLMHGLRRGFGTHNAFFVPAGKLLAFELGLQVQGQAILIPDDGRIALPDRTQHLRLTDALAQAEMTGILDHMRRESHEERSLLVEAMNAHAQLMSVALRRQIQNAGPLPPAKAADRIVRRYCDLLARDFRSGQSMATYAKKLDITPTHLTRVCRQGAGMTAADMLSQLLQHEVRSMLIHTVKPMNEIANALGFSSAAYFTRFSQHHFGKSPSQVRKEAAGFQAIV